MKFTVLLAAWSVLVLGALNDPLSAQSGKTGQQGAQPAPATAPAAAAAGKPTEPAGAEQTTATYGDWLLRCRNAPPPAGGQPPIPRVCELVQSVLIQGQTAPFAQLAFGRVAPGQPIYLTAVLPTNVAFPSAVKVQTDEKDTQPVELAWTRCLPGGCFASVVANEDSLRRWRTLQEAGRFTFKNGAGQDVTIPFSFRGLGRALEALGKEG